MKKNNSVTYLLQSIHLTVTNVTINLSSPIHLAINHAFVTVINSAVALIQQLSLCFYCLNKAVTLRHDQKQIWDLTFRKKT